MSFYLSYLTFSLIFVLLWGALYRFGKRFRREMLVSSIAIAPLGPIAEIWYLEDYWSRATITGSDIGIEDTIFSFALGGVSFALFKVLMNRQYSAVRTKRRHWLMYVFGLLVFVPLVVFSNILGYNSVVISATSFLVFSMIIWRIRPDLIIPSLMSGVLTSLVFIFVYLLMDILFPGVVREWCKFCNPSGLRFLGINLEEIYWDFSWGLVGGVAYEAVTGRKMERYGKTLSPLESQCIRSFRRFDAEETRRLAGKPVSEFGRMMFLSGGRVLPIRAIREFSFQISRIYSRVIDSRLIVIVAVSSPIIFNILLAPFGLDCRGQAQAWLLWYAVLNYFLLKFPEVAWSALTRMSDDIDSLLQTSADRQALRLWMKDRLSLRRQFISGTITASLGLATLAYVQPLIENKIEIGPASYWSVWITAFLGVNSAYWLWEVPLLIRRIFKFGQWNVRTHAPVTTPGIRGLSYLLGVSALMAAIGMVLAEMPIIFIYLTIAPETSLLLATVLSFAVTISTVGFVAVLPQYWLSQIARLSKRRFLDELSCDIEQIWPPAQDACEEGNLSVLQQKLSIYQIVESSPSLTVDKQALVSYTAALLASAVPFLQILLRP